VKAEFDGDLEFFNRIGRQLLLAPLPSAVIRADDRFLER